MNILLIDGGKAYAHSAGRLNHTLHQIARDTLTALGHNVRETVIDDGYDIQQEVEKFQWMDAVIWQMPGICTFIRPMSSWGLPICPPLFAMT